MISEKQIEFIRFEQADTHGISRSKSESPTFRDIVEPWERDELFRFL